MGMHQRRKSIASFFGTVAASSNVTLVSRKITAPFITKRIRASFALNVNRTLQLSFFISPDAENPTDVRPNGSSLLAQLGQVDFVVGDDEIKEFNVEVESPTANQWLKVFAVNADSFEHTIDAQIAIEFMETESLLKKVGKAIGV